MTTVTRMSLNSLFILFYFPFVCTGNRILDNLNLFLSRLSYDSSFPECIVNVPPHSAQNAQHGTNCLTYIYMYIYIFMSNGVIPFFWKIGNFLKIGEIQMGLRKCGVITIFTGNQNTIIFNVESRGRILCEHLFFMAEWRHSAVSHSGKQNSSAVNLALLWYSNQTSKVIFISQNTILCCQFISCGGMVIQYSEVCTLKEKFSTVVATTM